jgi:RNA-binding protein
MGNANRIDDEVGEVLHISKSGRMILKSKVKNIDIGTILIDGKGKRVAKVIELIGPVNAPYISAIPLSDRSKKYIGTKLYAKGSNR